jgi:hypothetical protein
LLEPGLDPSLPALLDRLGRNPKLLSDFFKRLVLPPTKEDLEIFVVKT